ncbi:uncharacterized protein LOC112567163 isoform X2 [Pomacea canaliculata]|uniref:uncharacterized protein LOC112567163 isoform X2 n=1 Tax=Pomacea canaliculata TaxID=400727 RepID=UPI000D72E3DF|nr:uncharacterized protein LOC112567163 isoform X2 [Pomacea canaliculata]
MIILSSSELTMRLPLWIAILVFSQTLSQSLSEDKAVNQFRTSACYGNINNFLKVGCPLHMKVKITEVGNGAKLLTQQCPLPADDSNYRAECCSYVEGDCYIPSRNAFPTECQNVNNCQPRATWADTSKDCNTNDFPPQTHYMEITYTCVADKTTLVTTVTTQTTSPTTTMDNTTTTTITTTHHHHVHRQHCRQQRGCSPAPQHRGTRNGRRSGTSRPPPSPPSPPTTSPCGRQHPAWTRLHLQWLAG